MIGNSTTRELLSVPDAFGEVQPEVLDVIAAEYPNQEASFVWQRSVTGTPWALRPMHELVLDTVGYHYAMQPDKVFYTLNTTDVEPGTSQYTSKWHCDGGSFLSLMVANTLPTEYLVADPESTMNRKERRRTDQMVKGWLHNIIGQQTITALPEDDALVAEGLAICQPADFCLTLLERQIHRSPLNYTNTPLQRTSIQASVSYKQPSWSRALLK